MGYNYAVWGSMRRRGPGESGMSRLYTWSDVGNAAPGTLDREPLLASLSHVRVEEQRRPAAGKYTTATVSIVGHCTFQDC